MSISILLVTQNKVGKSLVKAAEVTFKTLPTDVKAFCVGCNAEPENIEIKLDKIRQELDQGTGLLVLTDLYGSTASNIAHQLKELAPKQVKVISGVNLPMLLKAINYADLSLEEMAQKAVAGGIEGITCQ